MQWTHNALRLTKANLDCCGRSKYLFGPLMLLFSKHSNDVKVWRLYTWLTKKKLKEFHRLAYTKQNTCKIGKHWFPDWGQTFSQFIRWLVGVCDAMLRLQWFFTDFASVFRHHHFRLLKQSIYFAYLTRKLWQWIDCSTLIEPLKTSADLGQCASHSIYLHGLFVSVRLCVCVWHDKHVKVIAHSQIPFVFPQLFATL